MIEHAELVKRARELVARLDATITHDTLDSRYFPDLVTTARTLRTLADIVESYDRQPRFDENLKAIQKDLDLIAWRTGVQRVNAELHAACKTCDETIQRVVSVLESGVPLEPGSQGAYELWATGYLAKRAAETADTWAVVDTEYSELMKRLADTTNMPAEPKGGE